MATHAIKYPDWSLGGELRTILWNDETSEVGGDHVGLPNIRLDMATAVRDGHLVNEVGRLDLRDPLHDPADFLAVLGSALQSRSERLVLPPTIRSVKPTRWRRTAPPDQAGVVY